MSKDQGELVDASVDLAFSLTAFELYRKSGVLSAAVRSVPGMRGQGQATIELVQGKVVACYVLDRRGEHHPIAREVLVQLDGEKGPFSWVFRESVAQTPPSSPAPGAPRQPRSPIPQPLVYLLEVEQGPSWTPQQWYYLQQVFALVDGQHSVSEIHAALPLPPGLIDEVLRVLVALKAITF